MIIAIVPYQSSWTDEFQKVGRPLRLALGKLALRIDHVGSTAVPGLPAKDKIDIQITVASLEPAIEHALTKIAYARTEYFTDHLPAGSRLPPREWAKWVFTPPYGQRPTNVHVRVQGRANQRYALLFRDYLRAHPATAQSYGQVKQALAHYHPDDIDAYYQVKDPICDIIIEAAEAWAALTQWEAGLTDC